MTTWDVNDLIRQGHTPEHARSFVAMMAGRAALVPAEAVRADLERRVPGESGRMDVPTREAIRAWCAEQGVPCNERGPVIRRSAVDAYRAAHP